MSTERKLLAASICSRDSFSLIDKHVSEEDLTETGRVVLAAVGAYYERDAAVQAVDIETLTGLVLQDVTNPKHKATFEHILQALASEEVSDANIVAELLGAKREAIEARLGTLLASGQSKGVAELMDEYREVSEATDLGGEQKSELLCAPRVSDLIETSGGDGNRIIMYPRTLNERLGGGLLRGHHVVVFARPEMGKTMFIINACFGFLAQRFTVLYIGNEEPIEDIGLRMIGRLIDKPRSYVTEHADAAYEEACQQGYGNMYMQRMTPGTPREIEELVVKVKPDVLIVDQLRNIGMKEDNFVRHLEKAANAVRQIAGKHHCLAISITQAGDSATGKAVLEMGDVDSSNTGIPGACDVMIGIGATTTDEQAGRRVLSLPKNKPGGNHEFFPVRVVPQLSKITSMG